MKQDIELNEYLQLAEDRLGALHLAYAILVAQLHDVGALNGQDVVRSLRINASRGSNAKGAMERLADTTQASLERLAKDGPASLREI